MGGDDNSVNREHRGPAWLPIWEVAPLFAGVAKPGVSQAPGSSGQALSQSMDSLLQPFVLFIVTTLWLVPSGRSCQFILCDLEVGIRSKVTSHP